jgi:hypothetical protein
MRNKCANKNHSTMVMASFAPERNKPCIYVKEKQHFVKNNAIFSWLN